MVWFIPEWLVALALTLFALDIFLMTEVLSWGGVVSLAVWLTWRIDAPLKWSILIFLVSFTAFAFLYVFLLRNTIGKFVRKAMQGRSPDETLYSLIGKTGVVRRIGGNYFLSVSGELWPMAMSENTVEDGVKAKAISFENGEVVVAPI